MNYTARRCRKRIVNIFVIARLEFVDRSEKPISYRKFDRSRNFESACGVPKRQGNQHGTNGVRWHRLRKGREGLFRKPAIETRRGRLAPARGPGCRVRRVRRF